MVEGVVSKKERNVNRERWFIRHESFREELGGAFLGLQSGLFS